MRWIEVAAVVSVVACAGACTDRDTGGDDAGSSAGATGTTQASGSGSDAGSGSLSATGGGSADGTGAATTAATTGDDAGTDDTSAGCAPRPVPNPEYICCDGAWVDPRSDLFNCGGCGIACDGDGVYCDQGRCGVPACSTDTPCTDEQTCCGGSCCDAGTICCTINGPVEAGPGCVPPSDTGNCPAGCAPLCQCTAPDTPVATPTGDRSIAELSVGDLVYSVHRGETVAVPIAQVQRVPVDDHHVVRTVLDDGRILRISASHPLADGRGFGDLQVGHALGDHRVVALDDVAYDEPFTYDILPASSSGAYFVAGELVASTMDPLTVTVAR